MKATFGIDLIVGQDQTRMEFVTDIPFAPVEGMSICADAFPDCREFKVKGVMLYVGDGKEEPTLNVYLGEDMRPKQRAVDYVKWYEGLGWHQRGQQP